jgi:hypothetical protein
VPHFADKDSAVARQHARREEQGAPGQRELARGVEAASAGEGVRHVAQHRVRLRGRGRARSVAAAAAAAAVASVVRSASVSESCRRRKGLAPFAAAIFSAVTEVVPVAEVVEVGGEQAPPQGRERVEQRRVVRRRVERGVGRRALREFFSNAKFWLRFEFFFVRFWRVLVSFSPFFLRGTSSSPSLMV